MLIIHDNLKRYDMGKEIHSYLKSLPNEFGKGYTWHIIYENSEIRNWNTLYSSKGKDSFRKKEMIKLFYGGK